MPSRLQQVCCIITILQIALPAASRALRISASVDNNLERLWIPEHATFHESRDTSATCGGDSRLAQCGSSFPSDFCCPQSTTCLRLNTDPNVTAALCCPAGSDCYAIAPIACDLPSQNATLVPNGQYHSAPPTNLQTCGQSCCPQGYTCQNGSACILVSAAEAATSNSTGSAQNTSLTAVPGSNSTPTAVHGATVISITPTAVASTGANTASVTATPGFSGTSFAAGFVPGIAVGAAIVACVLFFCIRKKRSHSQASYPEKSHSSPKRDTLTDLHPDLNARPMYHGRTISEPTVSLEHQVYRTGFLNATPPQPIAGSSGDAPEIPKPLFSRSPFLDKNEPKTPVPAQSPIPASMKRGTLSFAISPVRALRKQRSMQSLRRQADSSRSFSARQYYRGALSRSGSTETIQVLMHTPDQRPTGPPPHQPSSSDRDSWESAESSPPTGRSALAQNVAQVPRVDPTVTTPTRAPKQNETTTAVLGTPYTPSNYGPFSGTFPHHSTMFPSSFAQGSSANDNQRLQPPSLGRTGSKRDTTFSAMMERAGVASDELVPKVPALPTLAPTKWGSIKGKGKNVK